MVSRYEKISTNQDRNRVANPIDFGSKDILKKPVLYGWGDAYSNFLIGAQVTHSTRRIYTNFMPVNFLNGNIYSWFFCLN